MKVERLTSEVDLKCGRCDDLGIKYPTIITGETYILLSDSPTGDWPICEDCYARLMGELFPEDVEQ